MNGLRDHDEMPLELEVWLDTQVLAWEPGKFAEFLAFCYSVDTDREAFEIRCRLLAGRIEALLGRNQRDNFELVLNQEMARRGYRPVWWEGAPG